MVAILPVVTARGLVGNGDGTTTTLLITRALYNAIVQSYTHSLGQAFKRGADRRLTVAKAQTGKKLKYDGSAGHRERHGTEKQDVVNASGFPPVFTLVLRTRHKRRVIEYTESLYTFLSDAA